MCEFISWIEYKGEILFLTSKELETKKGKALKKHLGPQYNNDVKGHGAIRWYYNLKSDIEKQGECADFSSPKNFPAPIIKAIKQGLFVGISPVPKNILRAPLYADYNAKCDTLDADSNAKRAPLYADYKAKRAPLDADYNAKRDTLDADLWKKVKNHKNRLVKWR